MVVKASGRRRKQTVCFLPDFCKEEPTDMKSDIQKQSLTLNTDPKPSTPNPKP